MDKTATAFLVLLFIFPAVSAQTTHIVGGSNRWNTGVDYATWAASQTLNTGDTLVFNYAFNHGVDEVSQADYRNCNTGNPISSISNSPTSITLSSPGIRYFICPTSNHCSQGMRLMVTVATGSTSPSPPGTTPSPPSGSPDTPTGTTAPLPPHSGATSILDGRKGLMIGLLSIVLVSVFELMG